MPSTVPLSQHHNFGIRDKGNPTTHKSPGSINSPKRIQLPGPPIRIKGLPTLPYTPYHLLP